MSRWSLQLLLMRKALVLVVPMACIWARHHELIILRAGTPLPASYLEAAKRLGIVHPERVRLRAVGAVPPLNALLRRVGLGLGLASPHTRGMTLRYGIYIRSDCWADRALLVHELAHVVQYERLGGLRPFLAQYLDECVSPGYPFGSLEQEAKQAELNWL